MKETDLSKAIDRAAEQRAKAILCEVRNALVRALSPYWRPKEAGNELVAKDIRNVLTRLATADDLARMEVYPSAEMVNACRAHIVNGLLTGLPKLQELAAMAMQDDGEQDDCETGE